MKELTCSDDKHFPLFALWVKLLLDAMYTMFDSHLERLTSIWQRQSQGHCLYIYSHVGWEAFNNFPIHDLKYLNTIAKSLHNEFPYNDYYRHKVPHSSRTRRGDLSTIIHQGALSTSKHSSRITFSLFNVRNNRKLSWYLTKFNKSVHNISNNS